MEFINLYAGRKKMSMKKKKLAHRVVKIRFTLLTVNKIHSYGLKNVTLSFFGAKNDAFSDEDTERYKNQDEEVRNYPPFNNDSKEDVFS